MEPLFAALFDTPILKKEEIDNIFKPMVIDQLVTFHASLFEDLQRMLETKSLEGVGSIFVKKVCMLISLPLSKKRCFILSRSYVFFSISLYFSFISLSFVSFRALIVLPVYSPCEN